MQEGEVNRRYGLGRQGSLLCTKGIISVSLSLWLFEEHKSHRNHDFTGLNILYGFLYRFSLHPFH
jgi:hypothetical protein